MVMRAKLTYGPFTAYIDVHEPRMQIAIPKPQYVGLQIEPDEEVPNVADIRPNRLLFMLKRSPRVGEVLEYEFAGEA